MKIPKLKRQMLIYYMSGFLSGILYANLNAKAGAHISGIFDAYFLKQYMQVKIDPMEYLFYLMQIRFFPFSILAAVGCTRFRKTAAMVFLLWTGFCGGMLSVAAVLGMGIKGIFFCMAGMFPHMGAYAFAYLIILWHYLTGGRLGWNHAKSIMVGVMMLLGIFMETYLNPGFVKAVIGLF